MRVGWARGFLTPFYGLNGAERIARIGFHRHGAVTTWSDAPSIFADSQDACLSRHLVNVGVLRRNGREHYALGEPPQAAFLSSDARAQARELGMLIGAMARRPGSGSPPVLGNYTAAIAAIPNPLVRTFAANVGAAAPGFTLSYTVVPTTLAPPVCASAAPAAGPDAIAWLQCSGFVQESRLSLRVRVDVLDAAGVQLLAQRQQYLTLRLFAEPPYSAPVGRKDGGAENPTSGDALAAPAHEGDLGGDTVSGIAPPPASPWPAGGTLIHVQYECLDGAGHCLNAAPPDPDGDLRFDARWTNGNQPEP